MAHLLVPRFADWVVMQVVERAPSGGDETKTVVIHRDPARTEHARTLGLSLISTRGELRFCVTNNSVIAPITARGRALGAIVVSAWSCARRTSRSSSTATRPGSPR